MSAGLRTACVAALLATAGACSASPAPVVRPERVSFAADLEVDLSASTRTPSGLYYRDLQVGTGPVATIGSTVSVAYLAALPTGEVVDMTRPGEKPLEFRIARGPDRPIAGFEQGTTGMRVGGTRQIVIPPDLAYGASGAGAVPPNTVLVFTVQLLGVR